jgi:hypothetical protein
MTRKYALGLLVGLLGTTCLVHSQEATERFIPIGESPGLSGKHTMLGEIQAVDNEGRTLTVAANGQTYSVAVTTFTRIWIDRSQQQQPALTGTLADCRRGLQVEVKLEDDEQERVADWIKIRPAAR